MKMSPLNLSAMIIALLTSGLTQADCKGPWSDSISYLTSDSVTYNGITYTAVSDVMDCAGCERTPARNSYLWNILSQDKSCPVISTPEPECSATSFWTPTTIYSPGLQVTYKGFIYGAYKWSSGSNPQDNIGNNWIKGVACHTPTPIPTPTPTPKPPKHTIPLPTQQPKPVM